MLYNPKWNKPYIEGFKAWLETKPPKEEFLYARCNRCAVGQYLAFLGKNWVDCLPVAIELNKIVAPVDLNAFIHGRQPTFGDVLREIEIRGLVDVKEKHE